jgi:multidrug efflux pump subunit AcrB
MQDREITAQEFMAEMRKELAVIPGLRANFQDVSIEGLTSRRGYPVDFSVQGPDWERLATLSAQMVRAMDETGKFLDVDSNYELGMPEVRIIPDRARAAAMGVSVEAVAQTVNAMVGGVNAGKFTDRGRRYDVRVRLLADQRTSSADVSRLRVRAATGELVPLSSLVRIEERPSLQQITRRNRERSIDIQANIAPGESQGVAIAMLPEIAAKVLPEGYRIRLSGSTEAFNETFRELIFALLLGVVVAYMILASQFNSFAHPVTVLASLPFSLTGALVALWFFDLSLNIYSFIGIILLMGIVKKNAILLVDFTNQRRLLGDSRDEALLHACPERLRPILMTTMSTIAGALPAALATGAGSELRQPMAWAVVGGTMFASVLTLYVVPSLYSILDGLTPKSGGAAATERETVAVLADIQMEALETHRHRQPVGVTEST